MHFIEGPIVARCRGEACKPTHGVGALGSGSLEQDGPLSIGAMEKEEQTGGRSITTDAGKRERHADETGQRLSQRVVPALHLGGFSGLAGPRRSAALKAMTSAFAAQKDVSQCPLR